MNKTLLISSLCAVTAATFFSGCASSTNRAEQRGFLGDYSQLQEGDKGEAKYYYINKDADFTQYTKIKFAPITAWRTDDTKLKDLDEETVKRLQDTLFASLYDALSKDFEIVDEIGPDVMLVRVAITEAVGANQALNSVSTVVPIGLVASAGTQVATGSHAFVGKAAIEAEVLDSISGHRLLAAVDERAGSKGFEGKWTQVDKAFDFWAERSRDRLERLKRASRSKAKLNDVVI